LDDFGTGYSSLSYLKDLPLDYLKIDRSFVVDAERENSLHLLEAILSLGKNMKLRTVAEGIETVEQLSLLIDLECDIYQGYYFSRPLRPNNFWSWAINHEN
jgi:EAL domain-containing protein (putative c-di-GMP-specific phosphodiesterase class I)